MTLSDEQQEIRAGPAIDNAPAGCPSAHGRSLPSWHALGTM